MARVVLTNHCLILHSVKKHVISVAVEAEGVDKTGIYWAPGRQIQQVYWWQPQVYL